LGFRTAAVLRQRLAGEEDGEIVGGDTAGRSAFGKNNRLSGDGLSDNLRRFEGSVVAGPIVARAIVTRAVIAGTVIAGATTATARAASATALPAASTFGIALGRAAFGRARLAFLAARGSLGGLEFRLYGRFRRAWTLVALFSLLVAGFAFAAAAVRVDVLKVGRVFFLLFEEIGDVEESVAFESDVDKRGLHAGKNPSDTALIDRAG
jgi:hypothetical protein